MSSIQNKRFSSSMVKQSLIVVCGKFGAAGLGYLIGLIIARMLGPEQFGLFSFFVVVTVLGSSLIGDAFEHAITRNYIAYKKNNSKNTADVLFNALAMRMFMGIPVIIIGVVFGEYIALTVFSDKQYAIPIILGCVGSFAMAIWNFSLTILQATESFKAYSLLTPVVNLLRALAIPILLSLSLLTLDAIIALHVGFYFLCGIVAIWFMRKLFKGGRLSSVEIKSQFHFSKWIAFAIICLLLQTHLAIPVLGYYSTKYAVGIYAAGATLLIIVDYITTAILTVQYPKVSKLRDLDSQKVFAKHSFNLSIAIALLLSPGLFIIEPIIIMLYGPEFKESVPVFQILLVGLLATSITQPLNQIFLAQNKSYYWTIIMMTSLVVWVVASFFLIPELGAIGAALTTTIARFSNSCISVILLFRSLYSKKANEIQLAP